MLPMYHASFLFLPQDADRDNPKERDWMLEVAINADKGLVDNASEPDDEAFELPAAEAASTLTFIAWRCDAATSANWYYKIWQMSSWPGEDGVVTESEAYPVTLIKKTYGLADLADAEAVSNAVLAFKQLIQIQLGIEVEAGF